MSPLSDRPATSASSPAGGQASCQRAILLALSGPLLISLALLMLLLQGRRGLQQQHQQRERDQQRS